jgi:hypothetical protein
MPDVTTAVLGDWRPLDELAKDTPYTNRIAFRRWLNSLNVPIAPVRRVPHARPADIQAALERQATARSVLPSRAPGRPRNIPQQAA